MSCPLYRGGRTGSLACRVTTITGARNGILRPADLALVEHPSAHHVGTGAGEYCPDHLVVVVGVASGEADALAKGREGIDPLMDARASVAEGIPRTTVWPGDEAVQRHADIEKHFAHVSLRSCRPRAGRIRRTRDTPS